MYTYGICETGLHRKNNEDTIFISDNTGFLKNLFIVADGMGGHNAGEIASHDAIEQFNSFIKKQTALGHSRHDILDLLIEAVNYCNLKIFEKSGGEAELSGMGTTMTVAVIFENKLYVTHVGDSRLYIFRNNKLRQVTKDHSFVMEMVKQGKMTKEEAAVHPNRNIITRAVGTSKKIEIDTVIETLEKDDVILMCSDGLSAMVCDADIEKILNKDDLSLEKKARELADSANENGGLDNISIILIRQEEKS